MDTNTLVALVGAKGMTALGAIYFINWMKKSPWFKWIGYETPVITHWVSAAISVLAGVGVHVQFSGGTLAISGLSLAVLIPAVKSAVTQYLTTKVGYHLLQDKINPTVAIPVQPEPQPVPSQTRDKSVASKPNGVKVDRYKVT